MGSLAGLTIGLPVDLVLRRYQIGILLLVDPVVVLFQAREMRGTLKQWAIYPGSFAVRGPGSKST